MCGNDQKPPENNFGEPLRYDPNFRGPLRKRSCTDIICLQLFITFMVCWIIIGLFAFHYGDSDLLSIPHDSNNKKCGYDSGVRDKPYLFFIDITKCADGNFFLKGCNTKQVCIEKCPESFYKYTDGLERAICADDAKPTDQKQLENYVNSGTCAKWYLPSASVAHRCLPKLDAMPHEISNLVELDKLERGVKTCEFMIKKDKIFPLVFEYITEYWWKICLFFIAAVLVCLLYIVLMRWVARLVTCFLLIVIIVLLALSIYVCARKYKKALGVEGKAKWLSLLILSCLGLTLTILLLLCLRKRIAIAIALIKEGSKAVSAMPSTLFFPIFPFILQVLSIVFAVSVCIYLMCIREAVYKVEAADNCVCPSYQTGDTCDPEQFTIDCGNVLAKCNIRCSLHELKKPIHIYIFLAVNIFGAFWSTSFVSDLGDMILAVTFATWYWTFYKADVKFCTLITSISLTVRNHLGTVAFGSLIIAICKFIRALIDNINKSLRERSCEVLSFLLCCKCFGWCLERCLRFINKNAYIMCAIHGKNFCKSAKNAFNLLMRNIVRVVVIDCVADLLLFLGKICITGGMTVIAYLVFTNGNLDYDDDDSYYTIVPVVVVAVATFVISNVFFKVYSMAIDTLFLCFLEDCERNDGSVRKPYFMSKELMKILGKRNRIN